MKYSSTDRPSRNEDLIGRGMISPFGLATRPRIAEIWRSWSMLPRAPEWIMIHSGLPCGSEVSSSLATSLVALVQISISSPRRSSAVMRPRWYCLSIRSASFSYRSRISLLRGGCTTSSMPMVTPDQVAQWNPASFSASSVAASCTFG